MQYKITLNGITLTLSSSGHAVSLINETGKNFISRTPFMVLYNNDKTEFLPTRLEVNGLLITVYFDGDRKVTVKLEPYENFFTVTLESVGGKDIFSVKFVNLLADIDYDLQEYDENAYALCLMVLTMATRMYEHPGKNEKLIAEAYEKTGFEGNPRSPYKPSCAIMLCRSKDLSTVQNTALDLVPNGELIKTKLGGPNAKNSAKSCQKTYTLHWTPITNDNYDETVSYFREAGIEQVNLHFMQQYSQGSFTVNPEYYKGGLEEYKAVVKRLHKDGFEVGLHCYVFFVSPSDAYITPVPHDDIDVLRTFTLKTDLSASDTELFTLETLEGVSEKTYYVVNNSNTIRIDNELIKFNAVDKSGKLYKLERGAHGTEIQPHKAGTEIKQYKEYFYHFLAKWGSPLFYEIARNTAKFYNEVGFDCIYFDALDGASCLEGEDFVWYTAIDFIREFWNNIDHDPVFNCCHNMQYTSTWFGRSRYGALDRPKACYVEYKDAHLLYNKRVARRMGVNEELGWLDLYPDPRTEPFYFQFIPVRKEDVSYVYGKCLGTGACCTFLESLPPKRKIPLMKEHWKTIREFKEYRDTHVLSTDACRYFDGERSYCLLDNGALKKADFNYYRFEQSDNVLVVDNKFSKQKPFIRLEALYQADDYEKEGIVISDNLLASDGYFNRISFETPINAEDKRGLGIWVKGDGKGGKLTVAPRIFAGNTHKWQNYYITNDFVGWKYFREVELHTGDDRSIPLMEMDNSTYNTLQKFYGYYFGILDYKAIEAVDVKYQGKGSVEIKPLKFLSAVSKTIVNPTLILNGKPFRINASLNTGDTIEIEKDGSVRIIDVKFNVLSTPTITGEIPALENGENTLEIRGENGTFTRLRVTVGVLGEELK